MLFPPILAHGALGWADEIIFGSVTIIFIGFMVLSWIRSRGMEPDEEDTLLRMVREEREDGGEDRFELD